MAFRPPKNLTLSRVVLFVLTAIYSLFSTILIIPSFLAASDSLKYANALEDPELQVAVYLRAALHFVIGHAGMLVSLLTGITALNILRSPEKKRLLANAQGVDIERIGKYVLRVVHLTLVLYVLLILVGWSGTFFVADLMAVFAAHSRDEYKIWSASTTSTMVLHLTASVGITLVGLAAALAKPTPLESSLRPVSPGTIDPEMPATSRV